MSVHLYAIVAKPSPRVCPGISSLVVSLQAHQIPQLRALVVSWREAPSELRPTQPAVDWRPQSGSQAGGKVW